MRMLKTHPIAVTSAAKFDYKKAYGEIRPLYLAALRRLRQLEHPVRTTEKQQTDLSAVRAFIASMPDAQGVVTCANIYNKEWFASDGDIAYAKLLGAVLCEAYESVAVLADAAYALWRAAADGELTTEFLSSENTSVDSRLETE